MSILIDAASRAWAVDRGECRAERGRVTHVPTGRSTRYGALADEAAKLPLPREVTLKRREEFRLIGTSIPRLDIPDKARGRAIYGWDVTLPGLRVASVRHSPVYRGTLRWFDDAAAMAVPGVHAVVPLVTGRRHETTAIAVVADGFWTAEQGLKALELQWNDGEYASSSSASFDGTLQKLAGYRARTVARTGAPRQAMLRAARELEASYETPFLAHVTMETMNCTARVTDDACELWVPTQNPTYVQDVAARICGLPASAVTVHRTQMGGGYGRRQRVDAVAEAVQIARTLGDGAPVKVLWSREEDVRHGYYRPAVVHQLSAGWTAAACRWSGSTASPGWEEATRSSSRASTTFPTRLPIDGSHSSVEPMGPCAPAPGEGWHDRRTRSRPSASSTRWLMREVATRSTSGPGFCPRHRASAPFWSSPRRRPAGEDRDHRAATSA